MLTRKQIDRTVRRAFLPFRCDVQIRETQERLRFKVFDHSRRGIVEISKIPLQQAQDERGLWNVLRQVRRVVENKGYSLNNA